MDSSSSAPASQFYKLKIFIASPGDVDEERKAALAVIHRVNVNLATHLGINVELIGWEDTLSSVGRPQAIINDELKECDFFIGIVWKRWGTPSGKESSGFYEEFKLALSLVESGRMNNIWLYFKKIPDTVTQAEADQVSQVTRFRNEINSTRIVLYKTFDTLEEWSNLLYDNIIKYLITKHRPVQLNEVDHSTKYKAEEATDEEHINAESALRELAECVTKDDYSNLSQIELSRSSFAVQATVYWCYPSPKNTLAHISDLSNLYEKKENIKLLNTEKKFLIHSLLADIYALKMGWFWLTIETDKITALLKDCLDSKYDSELRLNVLKILHQVDPIAFNVEVANLLISEEESLHSEVFELMVNKPTEKDLQLIRQIYKEGKFDKKKTWKAYFQLLSESNANAAVILLNQTPIEERSNLDNLTHLFSRADAAVVRPLLQDQDASVALTAFKQLKQLVLEAELRSFIESNNFDLAFEALLEMVRRKLPVTMRDVDELAARRDRLNLAQAKGIQSRNSYSYYKYSIFNQELPEMPHQLESTVRLAILTQKNKEELEKLISWNYKGSLAYWTLIEKYYTEYKEVLREDIDNRFNRLKGFKKTSVQTSRGSLDQYLGKVTDSDDYIQGSFMKYAVSTLKQYAGSADIPLAINLLMKPDSGLYSKTVQKIALTIIQQYGSVADVPVVKQFIYSSESAIQKLAISALLDLDKENQVDTILEFMQSDSIHLKQLVLDYALKHKIILPQKPVIDLLYHEQEATRLLVLAYIVISFTSEDLQNLLYSYDKNDGTNSYSSYYFNVVSWLDRLIYSPGSLRAYYRAELLTNMEVSVIHDWFSE